MRQPTNGSLSRARAGSAYFALAIGAVAGAIVTMMAEIA
jgi:hypothetical protein